MFAIYITERYGSDHAVSFIRHEQCLRQTQALIKTKNIRRRKVPPAILLLCRKHYYFVVKLLQSSNITSGTFLLLIFLSWSVPVSAEGRVEHQKLNQVGAARPPPGWVFGVQLDYSCHKKTRRGPVRAALVHIHIYIYIYLYTTNFLWIIYYNKLGSWPTFFKIMLVGWFFQKVFWTSRS